MNARWPAALALLLFVSAAACQSSAAHRDYPRARRDAVVDDYHGEMIADPYRWLEEADSPETRAWVEAENELTGSYLAELPQRETIRARLTELWDYERFELPVQEGGRVFYRRNDGLQSQSVLYVVVGDGAPRLLLDPNTLSKDGTVALASFTPSPDGKALAYSLSDGGSDWRTWKVRDVDGGADLGDVLTRNKFGALAWAADGSGVFYARYDVPPKGAELQAKNAPPDVCFHRLGTDEAQDVLIARRPAQEGRSSSFSLSEDGTVLFLSVQDIASRTNELYRLALAQQDGNWVASGEPQALVQGFDSRSFPIGDDGHRVWLQTDDGAPNGRIVALDPQQPARMSWQVLVPECSEAIQGADEVGGKFVVQYLKDARALVRVFEPSGKPLGEVALPGIGSVAGFGGDHDDHETFFSFTSFTQPAAIQRFDVASQTSSPYLAAALRFEPAAYETEQVLYTSKDGTRVPMFLTHKKGLTQDGRVPTYLYAYGGFGISITPTFSVPNLAWLEMGGLLAVPNLRGGGEYGEAWHEAGTKLHKQNVFDDFIAAAEWLIANGWTQSARLSIGGRSNGGLLVGACLTQRPELYGAALPGVGVLDMLRYHKFTIGWAWAGDYGTADDAAQFQALRAYSPLHNVRAVAYPSTLVTTADHDDRVVPAHSYKFTAALQAAQAGPEPVLIRIDTRAGHGAGKPTAMQIEEWADCWAFLRHELGTD
ncbi:MAG: S9 family peptidase [Planctomycetes bacterium]|nr:S9 family peptidase [Planctomycetota bacterium]